jgi:hypothetical protein
MELEQVLGLHIQRRSHGKDTHQRNSEESKQSSGMCLRNIGNRKWGVDFRRRMMMFESMIESILMYGAEVWGSKEQEEGS